MHNYHFFCCLCVGVLSRVLKDSMPPMYVFWTRNVHVAFDKKKTLTLVTFLMTQNSPCHCLVIRDGNFPVGCGAPVGPRPLGPGTGPNIYPRVMWCGAGAGARVASSPAGHPWAPEVFSKDRQSNWIVYSFIGWFLKKKLPKFFLPLYLHPTDYKRK